MKVTKEGVYVASKGKISLIKDTDEDGVADQEEIIDTGWKEAYVAVDATGLAIDKAGNVYFGLGCADFSNAYQLDKETNVLEGITIAGGFTDKAAPGRTRVIRVTDKGQQTLNVDMNDVIRRGQREKAIRLMENDVIVVPESFF